MVPATNTRLPAVTIGPPRFGVPKSRTGMNQGVRFSVEPSGTCHAMRFVRRSRFTRLPQGGALHGRPHDESNGSRRMAYGAPRWYENSERGYSPDARCFSISAGDINVTTIGM